MLFHRSLLCCLLVMCLISVVSARAQTPDTGARIETDVEYGEAGGQKLLLDVYHPETAGKNRPAVLFVHGGGWAGGDKQYYRDLATTLVKSGYVCFSINYRLAKETSNKYPAQIDDAQRAVRWIRANAAKYDVNPRRLGAIGDSAGGHLVSLLGTRETRDNSDAALAKYSSRVTCVVDVFGPSDLAPMGSEGDNYVPKVIVNIVRNFLGKTPQEAPELYREASPVTHVNKKTVPFLIVHGTKDVVVPLDQSQRLYRALMSAGIEAKLVVLENDGHGFQIKENQEKYRAETLAFFDLHLKGSKPRAISGKP